MTPPALPGPLLLVAAGGLAAEVAEAARAGGWHVLGAVDDDPAAVGRTVAGAPVLGGLDLVHEHPGASVVLCAGRGSTRAALAHRLDLDPVRYATVVHPRAEVPPSCHVDRGTVLLAGVVLTADVEVGRHVVVMPGAVLTHGTVVAEAATLCAGVLLGGGAQVGPRAYLGMGASVRQGVRVGAGAVLGMGAVLLEDLPADQVWAGVPAVPLPAGRGSTG